MACLAIPIGRRFLLAVSSAEALNRGKSCELRETCVKQNFGAVLRRLDWSGCERTLVDTLTAVRNARFRNNRYPDVWRL